MQQKPAHELCRAQSPRACSSIGWARNPSSSGPSSRPFLARCCSPSFRGIRRQSSRSSSSAAGHGRLQVAIRSLLRVSGGEEHFAFYSVMAGAVFRRGLLPESLYLSFSSGTSARRPRPATSSSRTMTRLVPANRAWISVYWVPPRITLVMVVILSLTRLPRISRKDDEKSGTWATYKDLFKRRTVILYFFLGIMAYVGTEQGVANWISQFLSIYFTNTIPRLRARAVSWFWGLIRSAVSWGLSYSNSLIAVRSWSASPWRPSSCCPRLSSDRARWRSTPFP